MTEILEKPAFIKKTLALTYTAITGIFGVIPNFIPSLIDTKVFGIKLNWLILILIIIILFIFNIIKFIWEVNKFYVKYQNQINDLNNTIKESNNNRDEIIKGSDEKDKLIKKQGIILNEVVNKFDDLVKEINDGITPVTDYEKKYLENLLTSANIKKAHIINLRGDDN